MERYEVDGGGRMRSARVRLSAGCFVGTFGALNSPAAVEILGGAGFDFVCLDAEHGALSRSGLESVTRAADVVGCVAFVRVLGVGPQIGAALDLGAQGVVVPRVESASDAQRAVAEARFPPIGHRGAGPGRASGYGSTIAQYLAGANDEVQLVVQVETLAGVRNAREIAAVDGVDGVLIGPGDLAVSIGAAWGSSEHSAAIASVIDAVLSVGTPVGIFCTDGSEIAGYLRRGLSFFLIGGDITLLAEAAQRHVNEYRNAVHAVRNDAADRTENVASVVRGQQASGL
jgi:4-hydroxy-2-oxoheptanedioate aldolase